MIELSLSRWSERQRDAIIARGENLLVSAGAGSGKTSVLIERIVNCIVGRNPVDVTRLLVVTFTEAAASEMRARLLTRLETLLAEVSSEFDKARYLQRQLSLLEQAHISTLHSFCMDVVRRNFLALNIDPGFTIVNETESAITKNRLIRELIEEQFVGSKADSFRQTLQQFGMSNPEDLSHLVFRIDEFSRSQPDPHKWLAEQAYSYMRVNHAEFYDLPWAAQFVEWMLYETKEAYRMVSQAMHLAGDAVELATYAENLRDAEPLVNSVVEALSSKQSLSDICTRLRSVMSVLSKSVRGKEHPSKGIVQEHRQSAKKKLAKVAAYLDRGEPALKEDLIRLEPAIAILVQTVIAFQGRYWDFKRSRGLLDFNDLEHLTLQVIRDEPSGEVHRLREQFAEIFVDEYQDTSPLQDAIIREICRPEGNVFVVGDVKQSIYRFRMAEPNLFMDKYATLGVSEPGKVIDLTANYRSRPQVVSFVNYVFEQLFSSDFGQISYDERAKMRVGAEYPESPSQEQGMDVEVHLIERKDDFEHEFDAHNEEESSAEAGDDSGIELTSLEKEAVVIGNRIQKLMGKNGTGEPMMVWDGRRKEYRPIEYKDIVILLRSVRGRMNTVLEILTRMGIPCYGATSTGFYGTLEVQWLLSAMSSVDNPTRELDFVTLLRSPIAGFTDEDLARLRLINASTMYESLRVATGKTRAMSIHFEAARQYLTPTLVEKAKQFINQFKQWRVLARRHTAEEVLLRILHDSQFEIYALGMKGGEVRRANIEALLEFTRAFDKTSSDGISGFVSRAKETLELELDSGEAGVLGESANVVRVMTIHQSKGLEYPVVFVADLGKKFFDSAKEQAFRLHPKLGFGPQFNDYATHRRWKTMASVALDFAERSETLAEEARVLYVAFTRAKEKLILVGSAGKLESLVETSLSSYEPGHTPLPKSTMLRASSYLDWLVPCFLRHPAGKGLLHLVNPETAQVHHVEQLSQDHVAMAISVWNTRDGLSLPDVASAKRSERFVLPTHFTEIREVITRFTDSEVTDDMYERVNQSLNRDVVTSTLPAKVTATDLRRMWVAKDEELRAKSKSIVHQTSAEKLLAEPTFKQNDELPSAKDMGTLFHAFMQYADLAESVSEERIEREIDRLVQQGIFSENEKEFIPIADVVNFLQSPLGLRLRNAEEMYREQTFFQRIQVKNGERSSFVVAQGVIDCFIRDERGWLIVDYKTDRVSADDVTLKAKEYEAQIAAYLEVVKNVSQQETVEAYIYFVRPGIAVPMKSLDLSEVFR